jgi:hypothetical protein
LKNNQAERFGVLPFHFLRKSRYYSDVIFSKLPCSVSFAGRKLNLFAVIVTSMPLLSCV